MYAPDAGFPHFKNQNIIKDSLFMSSIVVSPMGNESNTSYTYVLGICGGVRFYAKLTRESFFLLKRKGLIFTVYLFL